MQNETSDQQMINRGLLLQSWNIDLFNFFKKNYIEKFYMKHNSKNVFTINK